MAGLVLSGLLYYFAGLKQTGKELAVEAGKAPVQKLTAEKSAEAGAGGQKPGGREIFRNPFVFAVLKKPNPRTVESKKAKARELELVLQGFLLNNQRYAAFINDRLVEQGDKIMGWVVRSISENNVVLIKNGREKVLKL